MTVGWVNKIMHIIKLYTLKKLLNCILKMQYFFVWKYRLTYSLIFNLWNAKYLNTFSGKIKIILFYLIYLFCKIFRKFYKNYNLYVLLKNIARLKVKYTSSFLIIHTCYFIYFIVFIFTLNIKNRSSKNSKTVLLLINDGVKYFSVHLSN